MTRQSLEDGSWFDTDEATEYKEGTYHDGRNSISKATGTQWEHECLYRTPKKHWILNHWSQWQGSRETWEEIDDEMAVTWLIRNDHDVPEDCAEPLQALER